MHLLFSTSDHLNTNISDEQGNLLYNVSTPSGPSISKATKIHKYINGGSQEETMGIIQWPQLSDAGRLQFDGKVIPVNAMFKKRLWSSGLYVVGPDQHKYKWKLSSHCWMKPAKSSVELVRFHKKNLGTSKSAHPAYLDVSSNVASMLDFIVFTFVYAEWKRQKRVRRQSAASARARNATARRKPIVAFDPGPVASSAMPPCHHHHQPPPPFTC